MQKNNDRPVGTVVIDGYYGYGNAGDEAVLGSIIQSIRRYDPGARVIVSTRDPEYTTDHHDVDGCIERYLPRDGRPSREWLSTIRRADQFWIGGGGLFGDKKMLKYAIPTAVARVFDVRVATVCVGSGPFAESGNRLSSSTLDHADAVTVRDQDTARRLRRVGVRKPITVLADPVFAYEYGDSTPELPDTLDTAIDANTILVSVREPENLEVDIDDMAAGLSSAGERLDANVAFVPFHADRSAEKSDVAVARTVEKQLSGTETTVWDTELSFKQLLTAVDQAGVVVGMRLHSIIFAARVGTPFVGIPYAPKCVNHLERLKASTAHRCDDIDPLSLADDIVALKSRGLSDETRDAIRLLERIAGDIVTHIQQDSRACSRKDVVSLIGHIVADGLSKISSTNLEYTRRT